LHIKGKKNRDSCAEKNVVLQFFPSNFIFNQLPYFNAFSIWSLIQKRASNWPALGLQTAQTGFRKKIFLSLLLSIFQQT
jgi:hypothetical protein